MKVPRSGLMVVQTTIAHVVTENVKGMRTRTPPSSNMIHRNNSLESAIRDPKA